MIWCLLHGRFPPSDGHSQGPMGLLPDLVATGAVGCPGQMVHLFCLLEHPSLGSIGSPALLPDTALSLPALPRALSFLVVSGLPKPAGLPTRLFPLWSFNPPIRLFGSSSAVRDPVPPALSRLNPFRESTAYPDTPGSPYIRRRPLLLQEAWHRLAGKSGT